MRLTFGVFKVAISAGALAFAGCASGGESPVPYMQSGAALRSLGATGAGKIRHIVYIVQENRSFDNLFQGYPGADTVSSGTVSDGRTVQLKPVSLEAHYDIDHSAGAMFEACDGTGKLPGTHCRMDGFDLERVGPGGPKGVKYPQYVYVPHSESRPYFAMAHQGVLADDMFASQLDESFVAHQYVIAAQSASSVNIPYGTWGCTGSGDQIAMITQDRNLKGSEPPCFDYETVGDELDRANLSWRFYASTYGSVSSGDGGDWSSYQAVKHIYYGPDWKKDIISPNWRFIKDVRAGKLANFTWITPVCDDSDHVNCSGGYGPSWVAALVNTVGKSKFWNSTAIFIQWDDWGGLYDHVPPPFKGYDGLGFRVPLIIVSPYAKRDYVSHLQYETTSVLRFAEDLFGLPRLAEADRRATSPAQDCFDFSKRPRAFKPVAAPLPPKFFMHQRAANYFAPDYE